MLLGPSSGAMIAGILLWLLYAGLGIMAFLAFIRGMRALTEIPRRLERIEHVLAARVADGTTRGP
jgi:hypothetical protein